MVSVKADQGVCEGYGNCVLASSTTFDLTDDGLVRLRTEEVSDEELPAVRRAVYDCPTDAISLVED